MATRSLPARPNLDHLKLQARELQRAHRDGDASAAARIVAQHPQLKALSPETALEQPISLAGAQLVIAREYGFSSWAQLKQHVELAARMAPQLKRFENAADDIRTACQSGDAKAIERMEEFLKRRVTLHDIRDGVRRRLQRSNDAEISVADARDVVAGLRGFASWDNFAASVITSGGAKTWATPLYSLDERHKKMTLRRSIDDDEWDEIVAVITERQIESLDANGQMTDAAITRVADLAHVTSLALAGSARLSDRGLKQLARLPRLQHLDLSGCGFTDRGLEILRELPELRSFNLHWHQGVSDSGLANLASCHRLERVDLLGSPVGDGVVDALVGKRWLGHFKTGSRVTDAGLARLHDFPIFKTWHGGEARYSLTAFDVEPNQLLIDGPFTNKGLRGLRGLDGLFSLSFFWHSHAFTAAGLAPLAALPHLRRLSCEGERCTDEAMRHIATFPRLVMLAAQGTVASDAGFAALSRSQSIEYIWGRECPNLSGPGFVALSSMPSLRGLAVSCKNVDEASLAALPRFPALRELLPIDVSDAGFRYVGRCADLERLWCMYCRDTTDVATEHIAGFLKLRTYYAGQTKITDRSLEILGRLPSLEKLEFWNCAGITNAGAALLVNLPRLREISFDDCRHITAEAAAPFPLHVRVQVA